MQGSNQSGTPKTLAASNEELSQPLLANPNGPTRAEPPAAAAGAQPASPKPASDAAAGPSSSNPAAAQEAAGHEKGDHGDAAAPAELSASEFGMARSAPHYKILQFLSMRLDSTVVASPNLIVPKATSVKSLLNVGDTFEVLGNYYMNVCPNRGNGHRGILGWWASCVPRAGGDLLQCLLATTLPFYDHC